MGLTGLNPKREDLGRAVLATRLSPAFAEMVGHERLGPYLVQAAGDALLGHPPPPHWLADAAWALHQQGVVDSDRPGPQVTSALMAAFAVLALDCAPTEPPPVPGTTTREGYPRPLVEEGQKGRCPICDRLVRMMTTGRLRTHGPPGHRCRGSGQAPVPGD